MAKQGNTLKSNILKEEPLAETVPEKKEKPKKERPPRKEKQEKQKKVREPLSQEEREKRIRRLRVVGLFLLLLAVYMLFAFVSYLFTWQADDHWVRSVYWDFTFDSFFDKSTVVANWMGRMGALFGFMFINRWFGIASFLYILIFAILGLRFFVRISPLPLWLTVQYSILGIIWIPVFLGLVMPDKELYSGVLGYEVNLWLADYLGKPGLAILLGFIFFSVMIIGFNVPFRWLNEKEKTGIPVGSEEGGAEGEEKETEEETTSKSNTLVEEAPAEIPEETPVEVTLDPVKEKQFGLNGSGVPLEVDTGIIEKAPGGTGAIAHFGLDTKYDPTLDLPHYKFPHLDLLKEYGGESINVRKEELEANKDKIVETLGNYDIGIDKIKATIGPAVTLYEIVPKAGVRVSKIKNLEDDIALSLSALGIRIIAPIPGKGTIGIEVPNQNPEIVSVRSLINSEKFRNSTFELPFVLGKTIQNETYMGDLTRMPHILMAGATGQGKSVGLNTIITSLLYKKHPSQIKFIMIDPKKVELSLYSKIERHFLAKIPDLDEAIITDTKRVIRTLNSLCSEMDVRYDLLQGAQVRNIKEYNDKFISRKLNPEEGNHFLPYFVLVVDEFADLIMTAGREIETPMTRLAQMGRAVGVHLIIATQRPSVNIITGTIKANFPTRIAFRVISKVDSRTILDSGGADQLIGRGDMLLSTGSDLIRLQCAFIDTPEVENVADFIGSQRGYPETYALPDIPDEENGGTKEFNPNEKDEFFEEAARLVVQHQHGSTSLIQRKLKLGYNRAGRIIDQLESAGIVGPFEGSKAREVRYKDMQSLENYLRDSGNLQ